MDSKEIKRRILYEDNHLLVFNKPSGIPSQPDISGDLSIPDAIKAYIKERDQKPGNVYLGLVHRLDRPVSGVMVLAKSAKSLSRLTQAFRDRKVTKVYHAIVCGIPKQDQGTLEHYHKKDSEKHRALLRKTAWPGAKKISLEYELLKHINHYSLLKVIPSEGKFHQIRAQLSKAGNPIAGDLKYGAKRNTSEKLMGLHAHTLILSHPTTGQTLSFYAPYPVSQLWGKFSG